MLSFSICACSSVVGGRAVGSRRHPSPPSSHTRFTTGLRSKAPASLFSRLSSSRRFWPAWSTATISWEHSRAGRSWWMVGPQAMSISASPLGPSGAERGNTVPVRMDTVPWDGNIPTPVGLCFPQPRNTILSAADPRHSRRPPAQPRSPDAGALRPQPGPGAAPAVGSEPPPLQRLLPEQRH